ncbi:MAG: TadE family protein [Candidatus Nanopelagicales bacterium]
MPTRSNAAGRTSGAVAVEAALILPIILMVLFGIIDFGRLQYERITVTQAAIEGARASFYKRGDAVIAGAVTAAAGPLSVVITAKTNDNCATPDTETTVTVARPSEFVWLTPVLRSFHLTVTATGAFHCLN